MEPIRLSVAEAAKFFGIQTGTIRRAIKEGKLNYVVIKGRYKINFEGLLKWSQSSPKISNKFASRGMGQYVDKWKIRNKLFSPNPEKLKKEIDDPS